MLQCLCCKRCWEQQRYVAFPESELSRALGGLKRFPAGNYDMFSCTHANVAEVILCLFSLRFPKLHHPFLSRFDPIAVAKSHLPILPPAFDYMQIRYPTIPNRDTSACGVSRGTISSKRSLPCIPAQQKGQFIPTPRDSCRMTSAY